MNRIYIYIHTLLKGNRWLSYEHDFCIYFYIWHIPGCFFNVHYLGHGKNPPFLLQLLSSRWHPKSPFRFVIWRRPSPTASRLEMFGGDFLGLKQEICRIWVSLSWIAFSEWSWIIRRIETTLRLFGSTVSLAFHFFLFGWCIAAISDAVRHWRESPWICMKVPLWVCWARPSAGRLKWTRQQIKDFSEAGGAWGSVRHGVCIPLGYITLQDHFGWFLYWWAADSMAG